MKKKKHFTGLSGAQLKWFAVIAMFLDHVGVVLIKDGIWPRVTDAVLAGNSFNYLPTDYTFWLYSYSALRIIGRLSFPIYCFLLVEGFCHTKSKKNYAIRLGLFALLSEIPFDLAFHHSVLDFSSQNVFFTLFIGFIVLIGIEHFKKTKPHNDIIPFALTFAGMVLAFELNTDYSDVGVLIIAVLYAFRDNKKKACIAGALTSLLLAMYAYGIATPLAFLPVWFYNGERGKQPPKWFFYGFYPAHLLLLFGLQQLLF